MIKKIFQRINQKKTDTIFTNVNKRLVFNVTQKNNVRNFKIPTLRQLKYTEKVLTKKERFLLKFFSGTLLISIIFLGFTFYFQKLTPLPINGGHYNEALIGHPQFINPVLAQTNNVDADLTRLIYSGLLNYNEKHELIPDIASGYEISDDRKKYTFHLKNNVIWHDGEPLTADDVIYTINVIQDPAYNSPIAINFDGVMVEKIDDYTIVFSLNEPYAPFLDILSVGILPSHLWNNVPPTYFPLAEYNIKPIGTGPYMFESLTKDKTGNIRAMTLSLSKNYYSALPFIESLTFKFYPDFTTAVEALFNKNVQGISKLPRDSYEKAESISNLSLYHYDLPQYSALFFNLSQESIWNNKELRKALLYAIDQDDLINTVLPGYAKKIEGPILDQSIEKEEQKYEPEKSRELFEKNGWKLNEDGLRYKGKIPLSITITTINQFDNQEIAQYLQNYWKDFGVDVKLEIIPFTDLKEKIKQRSFESLLYGQLLGNDNDPYPFWHSTQRVHPGLNLSMFANKKADELIENARTTLDQEKRNAYYKEFQELMINEIPALFLYQPIYTYAVDKKIKNVMGSKIVYPADRFDSIFTWYIKTKRKLFQ